MHSQVAFVRVGCGIVDAIVVARKLNHVRLLCTVVFMTAGIVCVNSPLLRPMDTACARVIRMNYIVR